MQSCQLTPGYYTWSPEKQLNSKSSRTKAEFVSAVLLTLSPNVNSWFTHTSLYSAPQSPEHLNPILCLTNSSLLDILYNILHFETQCSCKETALLFRPAVKTALPHTLFTCLKSPHGVTDSFASPCPFKISSGTHVKILAPLRLNDATHPLSPHYYPITSGHILGASDVFGIWFTAFFLSPSPS